MNVHNQVKVKIRMTAIYKTGIRSGEVITSMPGAKQNNGTVMKIRGNYPVSVGAIPTTTGGWYVLSDELYSIPFFRNMTMEEKANWLLAHTTPNTDLYLSDPGTGIYVKFLSISGTYMLESLSPEIISMLLQGNPNDPEGYWNIEYVYNLLPKKPGSRARRHSLVFRPSNWRIMTESNIDTTPGYMTFDVDAATVNPWYTNSNKLSIVASTSSPYVPGNKYSVLANRRNEAQEPWGINNLLFLVTARTGTAIEVLQSIIVELDFFTPALYKSLIQKMVRTGASTVTHNNLSWKGVDVLCVSFLALLTNPGSFVPDLQKFVTGAESALKRLAVSICEDSAASNYSIIMSLYAGAMVASKDTSWKPTNETIGRWLDLSIIAHSSPYAYVYETSTPPGYYIREWNPYNASYFLLNELRSFQTDIGMLASIATNGGKLTEAKQLMPNMILSNCLDHHSLTEIGYYYSYDTVVTSGSYPGLFSRLFTEVTGVNPRRDRYLTYWQDMETYPFVKETRIAQSLLWTIKTRKNTVPRVITNGKYRLTYELDYSVLAGLIGPLEVKVGKTTIMIVLKSDGELLPIRRPGRDEKEEIELTEQEKYSAVEMAYNLLAMGYALTIPDSLAWMRGMTVYRINGVETKYSLLLNGVYTDWDTYRNLTFEYSELEPIEPSIYNAITTFSLGVSQQSDDKLRQICSSTNTNILAKLLGYLASPTSRISMNKISRDGTGQEYSVPSEDTGVFSLLCSISVLYPAYLQLRDSKSFDVTGPGLWKLKETIFAIYRSRSIVNMSPWNPISDLLNRKLWNHQIEAVQYMKQRHDSGRRGNLIWIPVGLGKTLITMTYISELIRDNRMPEYCVYTLPPSAMDSIVREITYFGLTPHIIDMRQDSLPIHKSPSRKTVNLIPHDTLRSCPWLKDLAPNCLFIVDEFHKTLNKTQRTSVALEVARLSYDFVCMSGTIVSSDNVDDLVQWLRQIVDFEVTEKNFWVAIGNIISRKVSTRLIVERLLDEADMTEQQKTRYQSLVDGGRMSNEGFLEAVRICRTACYLRMVRLAAVYISLGERVFLVAKNTAEALEFRQALYSMGVTQVFVIGTDGYLTLTPRDIAEGGPLSRIQAVITTLSHNAGYSLSAIRVMITSVYFVSQVTREQMEGRITRIDSLGPEVNIITVTVGLLTSVFERYEKARSLSAALKEFAVTVSTDSL